MSGEVGVHDMTSMLTHAVKQIDTAFLADLPEIPSGIPLLDLETGGLAPGEVVPIISPLGSAGLVMLLHAVFRKLKAIQQYEKSSKERCQVTLWGMLNELEDFLLIDRAVAEAEKEEKMYRDLLARAREELGKASEEERLAAEQRIADLEQQLAEAKAKEQRAKSMAEMTRRGHVYVISNIGSFGEIVYKIGLTRRLDPMERVKELGDASVPFSFDVHALIYTEDAPALEAALHREFTDRRVNAVNLRKEFFKTDLASIKEAAE
jgi:hypothetical protein